MPTSAPHFFVSVKKLQLRDGVDAPRKMSSICVLAARYLCTRVCVNVILFADIDEVYRGNPVRYDGRGHLHDLSEYDSGSWNTSYQLSEEEARIEALCDEERYLALHTDLMEEEARQEEEYKRLSEALADEGTYNAVAFKYSADYYDPSKPTEEEDAKKVKEEPEPEESEEPFVAPEGLEIPPDVELPATIKTHNIMERTASFVCQQGAQFEIVLKAKQARNSQFDFLRFDHYLNPYYKHILKAMKEGRYNLASSNKQEQPEDSNSDDSDDDGDGNYLHPSLFAPKRCSRLEELMKPLRVMDPDHPLAALVRKARAERNGLAATPTVPEEASDPAASNTTAQYTADPNASAMYYGYYMLPDGTYCMAPPPPGVDASSYYSSVASSGITPSSSSVAFPQSAMTAMVPTTADPSQVPTSVAPVTIAGMSNYRAEAQVSTVAAPPAIIPPPLDIQAVIDKLAEYVVRNGLKFESSVRAKNDPRFDFLQPWNQYNSYYEYKKNYFMQKEGKSLTEMNKLQWDESGSDSKISKASFAPICFAIKAKENDLLPLEKNRVKLDDDSDEDKLLEGEGLQAAVAAAVAAAEIVVKELPHVTVVEEKRRCLTLELQEAKQAKQRLEDRLAAAAREKLAQASKESKEKQLQAERKRKAALFLQTLRSPLAGEPEAKRAELDLSTRLEMQEALSLLSDLPPSQMSSVTPAYLQDERSHIESRRSHRSREAHSSSHNSTSRSADKKDRYRDSDRERRRDREREKDRDRERERERDKKKKKHKRRSRSRSTSRPKSRHSLPSAYKRSRRSRSRSYSPVRRSRDGPSSERRQVKEREPHHHSSRSSVPRELSKSRSPFSKRQSLLSSRAKKITGATVSPYPSPNRALSPSSSPASSLAQSRGASQEKEEPVSSSIVSAVQSKITQDLMAKVRAMLASSKTFQPPTS